MTLLGHRRVRRQVSLLASGVLPEPDRPAVERHLAGCARCREELAEMRQLLELVAHDPMRLSEPQLPLSVLETRVRTRLEAPAEPRRAAGFRLSLWPVPVAVAAGLLLAVLLRPPAVTPPEPPQMTVSDEFLDRLDRNLARQQAARYLSEAQDVLVTVAATPSPSLCDREEEEGEDSLDVADESRRSRELLARRTLLVEMDGAEVASARPVLEDVDNVLRELAMLPACARAGDLKAIHQQIAERRLLMKISLMTRELSG
jgi:anti-sigma factor RsiW